MIHVIQFNRHVFRVIGFTDIDKEKLNKDTYY